MKKVLTFGVFDIIHRGHIRLFERAKQLGDFLIVAVQTDENILKYKPNTQIINSIEERVYMVKSIRFVDKVLCYDDVDEAVKTIDFDVLVLGEDQNHMGFQRAREWCSMHKKEVVVLERTKGISSTMLREIKSR